ncbi:MAG: GHKL domain-containing protein [Firmicutes bacterium]|nr:GHKL domain-containing protein [Bacillota bacterium]
MMNTIIFFTHSILLLLYGLLLSFAFAGVRFSRKNFAVYAGMFLLCGLLQLIVYALLEEALVWKLYPCITHLPIIAVLCLHYRKRFSTSLAATTTAYLCCQPANWIGLLVQAFTEDYLKEKFFCILMLLICAFFIVRYMASPVSEIYSKDNKSVWIFGMVPIVYYFYDYVIGIYMNFWRSSNQTVSEFLPFFLSIVHLIFCAIYYKEYEQKADAERKEAVIRLTAEQQARQIEAIKHSEFEISLLRHDMRLFLNNLSVSIGKGDEETALKMIAEYIELVDSTTLKRYSKNDTLNYVLTGFAAQCHSLGVDFKARVEIGDTVPDELMLSMIISNALDNALNAQKNLPTDQRQIRMSLKTSGGKILLSVRNPFLKAPVFVDGIPISRKNGHGYGIQSIRYMAERLNGNCQFSVQGNHFLLRVILPNT